MSDEQLADVIVAGAGPAGLVCAVGLAKAGLRVRVLEVEPDIPSNLRGSTFHPSTLDMLERSFGAATPLIERGLVAPTVQYRRHQAFVIHLNVGENARDRQRMINIRLAGQALLAFMSLSAKHVSAVNLLYLIRRQI